MADKFDVKRIAPFAAAALLILLLVNAFDKIRELELKEAAQKKTLADLTVLAGELGKLNGAVESFSGRLAVSETSQDIIPLLDELFGSLGMTKSVKEMRPGESKRAEGFLESAADIEIERTDLNHAVNLVYRIKNHPALLKIGSLRIKTDFQNPDMLNISMSVSLIRQTGQTKQQSG